ncbi:MAG: type II toxin-antitoxin system Phd/YefM family antitoxin [Limisphaerales bacterium]
MQTVELEEAQSRLTELVESLTPGAEIVIEKNHRPVARLLPTDSHIQPRRPRPLREFAGKYQPLPQAEQDDVKLHDKAWCDPNA